MFFGWYKIWTLYPILTKFRLFILRRIGIKKNSFHFSLEIKQRKDRIFISSSFLFSFFFLFSLFNLFLFFLSPAFSQLQPTIEKFIYLLYITTLIIYSTSQSPIYNTPYKKIFFFLVSHNEDQHNPNNPTVPTHHKSQNSATTTHT